MAHPGVTAFVSHPDCARHDTGWKHPDHQGRLPALVRAVYRDMLQLHGHLLEVEAVPAAEEQLLRVHTGDYIRAVQAAARAAAEAGEVQALAGDVFVSGASWDAALAAAGSAITGVDVVMRGEARNAFCAARPPGHAAARSRSGGFSLFNNVALAARHAVTNHRVGRVLVVEWSGVPSTATRDLLAADPAISVIAAGPAGPAPIESRTTRGIGVPDGCAGEFFRTALEAGLDDVLSTFRPDLILLAAGFDILASDPVGRLGVDASEVHALTRSMVDRAESACEGRLVSVLEGGYDPPALGRATVQHLRALAGLAPA
jgi:acetoin utilization deacetylase AcuC-like enzyme